MTAESVRENYRRQGALIERERILALLKVETERCFCEFPLQHLEARITGEESSE